MRLDFGIGIDCPKCLEAVARGLASPEINDVSYIDKAALSDKFILFSVLVSGVTGAAWSSKRRAMRSHYAPPPGKSSG